MHINFVCITSADLLLRTPVIGESLNRPPLSNLTNSNTESTSQRLKNKGKLLDESYVHERNLFEEDCHNHNNVPMDSYHDQLGIN